ncbi:MAG: UDP-N-acetylglucosamine 2-epimerase (non-hydrolyzing) [Magnetococcales bacterium]|nr:UDP-N-acetylglucosamine 2-epimerase (non-hydrolyzing) [Magnetococcales bacterium]|tara:strand:+ start:117327 stop:118313 length:987 start_codon:yes stop_codon:yes gene_type:complete
MILVCFGTRPEYIKVKSIIDNLNKFIKICFISQHKDLLKDIKYDYYVPIDKNISNNRLNDIISNIMDKTLFFKEFDYILVQGDTTSALASALSAFNQKCKIIHLEAGLRSGDLNNPYPEELNRQLISRLATIHLCPTQKNKDNLLKENVSGEIHIVGNTGLDNISLSNCSYDNKILITIHRRDNLNIIKEWFEQFNLLANKYLDIEFIFPMHPNPLIQKYKRFLDIKIKVIEPLSHTNLINIIKKCKLVISDSGGLQEECSFLNKKIIVCRKNTERPESLNIHSYLCESPSKLIDKVDKLLKNYNINESCPYGNGKSWIKIKKIICKN